MLQNQQKQTAKAAKSDLLFQAVMELWTFAQINNKNIKHKNIKIIPIGQNMIHNQVFWVQQKQHMSCP